MLTILVIDDEKVILEMFKRILEASGFNVKTAPDGKEGIKMFDNGLFDLVITDMSMPGMDGNCEARHIRHSDRQFIPIIGVSGTPGFF